MAIPYNVRTVTVISSWKTSCPVIVQALQTLDKVITEKLEALSEITATPTSQLKFVTDAWSQVVDCRRMLKWTYAFGYYRFADDSAANKPQQEFFEFNQVWYWLSIVHFSLGLWLPNWHLLLSQSVPAAGLHVMN